MRSVRRCNDFLRGENNDVVLKKENNGIKMEQKSNERTISGQDIQMGWIILEEFFMIIEGNQTYVSNY